MNFSELIELFANWPALVAATVVVTPIAWLVFAGLHRARIAELESKERALTERMREQAAPGRGRTSLTMVESEQRQDVQKIFAETGKASQAHLLGEMAEAQEQITVFGLTRNFFVSDAAQTLLARKAFEIPVVLFMMDPACVARRERYRIEPTEAAMEDPERYRREIEAPFRELLARLPPTDAGSRKPGLGLYYYNFPCSFAIEQIDSTIRVMLYGHGKRGTEGPIFVFDRRSELGGHFASQLRWLEGLTSDPMPEPWRSKGVSVTKIRPIPSGS